MEVCRACLSTDNDKFPLNKSFITNYNMLTNLQVAIMDGMPQFICRRCLETVNLFIEFREKSALSESKLRDLTYAGVAVKPEYYTENFNNLINNDTIKHEIKEELKNDALSEDEYEMHEEYEYLTEVKTVSINTTESKPRHNKKINPNRKCENKSKDFTVIKVEDETQLFCGICTKSFFNNSELTDHLVSHKGNKDCQQCDEVFDSWSQLLGHRLTHIPSKQRHCHICLKRFISSVYLEYHYRNLHVKEEGTKLRCKPCNSLYDSPRKFKKHMWSIHGDKKYVCDNCSKRYHSKSALRKHIAIHVANKPYICDICGFKSKFLSGLKDHKIRKHSETKVYCKVCHRPFKNEQDHDKHKCTKKTVMCPVCGIQFSRTMKLSRHMNVHTDIHKYECNKCPAKFKSRYSLKIHHDRHDGNRTKHCEYCPAKFFTGSSLIKHRRIHTGEKPYVCKVCNKGFTGNHNLKVHMKVHGEYNLINKKNKESDSIKAISTC